MLQLNKTDGRPILANLSDVIVAEQLSDHTKLHMREKLSVSVTQTVEQIAAAIEPGRRNAIPIDYELRQAVVNYLGHYIEQNRARSVQELPLLLQPLAKMTGMFPEPISIR